MIVPRILPFSPLTQDFISICLSFNNVLLFSLYKSLTPVIDFISKYFSLFHNIGNGIEKNFPLNCF